MPEKICMFRKKLGGWVDKLCLQIFSSSVPQFFSCFFFKVFLKKKIEKKMFWKKKWKKNYPQDIVSSRATMVYLFFCFFQKSTEVSFLSLAFLIVLITKSSFLGHFCVTHSQTHSLTHSLTDGKVELHSCMSQLKIEKSSKVENQNISYGRSS